MDVVRGDSVGEQATLRLGLGLSNGSAFTALKRADSPAPFPTAAATPKVNIELTMSLATGIPQAAASSDIPELSYRHGDDEEQNAAGIPPDTSRETTEEGESGAGSDWGRQSLRSADEEVWRIVELEKGRQLKGIELIASENFVSQVRRRRLRHSPSLKTVELVSPRQAWSPRRGEVSEH